MSNDTTNTDRAVLREEHERASHYWGGFQWRIVVTFLLAAAAWTTVLVLGTNGTIPLWLGLIVNTVLASTFYMPMHEAVHRNITGTQPKGKRAEDVIGMLCSVPLLMSFRNHRPSHLRHHSFTNDDVRDPDHFTHGTLGALPAKAVAVMAVNTLLPVFALVPAARRLLPSQMQRTLAAGGDRKEGLVQLRFWLITHAVLLAAVLTGFGWPAFLLWYLPARLQLCWLIFIFAWYPHHPADAVGRYADTRVAVFPGSRWLIRGHDHHAMHHMFPRVPHYHLRALWADVADDMVSKGVRAEGSAVAATGPVVW